jgi:PAS domain S-box-containing protein
MHQKKLTGVVASLFDFTDRKKAQEALEQQLQITETVTNIASNCLFMIDTSGLVTYMNPAAENVTGYSQKECIGKPMHSLVHHSRPDGSKYPEADCPLVQTYKYGKPNPQHEDVFFRKNGSPFPALITGTPIPGKNGIQSTVVEFRDITEDKRAIHTLAESEARLRFMAESLPQKIFTADAKGKITYLNSQWAEYTGLPIAESLRDGVRQFIHPDDLPGNMGTWRRALKSGDPLQNEQRLRRADGMYRRHISHAKPMRDENGKITQWFGSMTDIEDVMQTTARKEELEIKTAILQEQRAQLITLNAAKDEFISLASHQLRTPATAVKQYLGMVLEGFSGKISDDQKLLLTQADTNNERQITIINDLLRVAQVDAGKVRLNRQLTELGSLLQEVIDGQNSKFIERNQSVIYKRPSTTIHANVDPERVRMVLENIVDNASKYTPPWQTS